MKMKKIPILVLVFFVLFTIALQPSRINAIDENKQEDESSQKEVTFLDIEGNVISENENVVVENTSDLFNESGVRARSAAITNGVVNFNTKGNATTSYVDSLGKSGYTNGAYGADAAFLGYDASGRVKFMLSGVVGSVAASEVQVLNYDTMNNSQNSVSFYRLENGRLIHYITTNVNTNKWASANYVGPGPAGLVANRSYYSYDGIYFFDTYAQMIQSYKNNPNSGVGSVNASVPYYNYYQFLNLRSKTSVNATQLNDFIVSKTLDLPSSKMRNLGGIFVDYGAMYGVNPLLAVAVAGNESAWGKSTIALTKNNLFGLNAVDSSPMESANYYPHPQASVKDFMETYMSKRYLFPSYTYHNGSFLGNKNSGINLSYASDPYWGEKASAIAWNISSSINEKNTYTIGMKKYSGSINVRSQPNSSSALLYSTKPNEDISFIILSQTTGSVVDGSNVWYRVQSDAVLNAARTQGINTSGNYVFGRDYGYVHSSLITKIQNGNVTCQMVEGTAPTTGGVVYQGNIEDYCWQNWVANGATAGSEGIGKRLEGFKVKVNGYGANTGVSYRSHVQTTGWESWKSDGQNSGSLGGDKRIEAIEMKLNNMPNYSIQYRAHVQGIGWQDWKSDGQTAGTTGQARRIEAIQIRIVKINNIPNVNYRTHIQSVGWQEYKKNGEISGTSGKALRLEGININLNDNDFGGGIEYSTHIQSIGWQNYVRDNTLSGTNGKALRLEAIKIRLYGAVANEYDVYYRVHAQSVGWLDWAKNGEVSGSAGMGYRLEAIQIKLVKKGGAAPGSTAKPYISSKVSYQTHIQSIGWQPNVKNGEVSGTTGKGLRLEGIKINKIDDIAGDVTYRTHVQKIGWQPFKKNGEMSGTSGQGLRLEAIEINLTGELANKYDVYYRVHSQSFGWLGWAKNGAPAGTAGYAYRLEGIQIVFVEKGGAAPGSTANAFKQK